MVLCGLSVSLTFPTAEGKAHEQFKKNGATSPGGWRYFALAKAHQGLLTGNREAGYQTIANHLDHPQMHGWYAFDEGGRSGPGGWRLLSWICYAGMGSHSNSNPITTNIHPCINSRNIEYQISQFDISSFLFLHIYIHIYVYTRPVIGLH